MRTFILMLALLPAAASAQSIQPGQWETTVTITEVRAPNLPPQVASMMKGRPNVVRHCVTPAEAAAGPRSLVKTSPDCAFDSFSLAGGRYASKMRCTQNGTVVTTTANGTYTPTSIDATSTMVMTGKAAMTMIGRVSAKRVGACK